VSISIFLTPSSDSFLVFDENTRSIKLSKDSVSLQNLLDARDHALGFAIILRDPNEGKKTYFKNIEIMGSLSKVIANGADFERPTAFIKVLSNRGLLKIRFSQDMDWQTGNISVKDLESMLKEKELKLADGTSQKALEVKVLPGFY